MESDSDSDELKKDVFVKYVPNVQFGAFRHPGPIVETACLSSVTLPRLTYKVALPEAVWKSNKECKLSGLQLEAIAYAGQAHCSFLNAGERDKKVRQGFILADGPGVGKGRTIAGVLIDNYLKGRKKSVWVSVSKVLLEDARRDLAALTDRKCSKASLFTLPKGYDKIPQWEGVLFVTYATLCSVKRHTKAGDFSNRVDQIVDWLSKKFRGPIIFDEVHRAKNYESGEKGSKIGEAVFQIQNKLPSARVMYVSATLATDVEDVQYMTRMGLWGIERAPVSSSQFVDLLNSRPMAFKELVPVELKEQGLLVARQLSLEGILFKTVSVKLTKPFQAMYDDCCLIWMLIYKAAECKGGLMSVYWAQHQRFFKSLCTSSKIDEVVRLTHEMVESDKAVIIGLQTTGEAALKKFKKMKLNDPSSKCSLTGTILEDFIFNHLKLPKKLFGFESRTKKAETKICSSEFPMKDVDFTAVTTELTASQLNAAICEVFKRLKPKLPVNPLDDLIWKLGGQEMVSEMTGRVTFPEAAQSLKQATRAAENLAELKRFLTGITNIAIISEAASTGISLHSSNDFANHRQRVHIVLEIPWSANSAIQQMGRTNRTNQRYQPEYFLMKASIPGEQRFASSIANRIRNMGAMSKGDERSSESVVWNEGGVEQTFAKQGLKEMMKAILGQPTLLHCFTGSQEDKKTQEDLTNILKAVNVVVERKKKGLCLNSRTSTQDKFLNRVLGVPLKSQKYLVGLLTSATNRIYFDTQAPGQCQVITDLNIVCPGLKKVDILKTFQPVGGEPIRIRQVECNTGLTWDGLVRESEGLEFFKSKPGSLFGSALVYAVTQERISMESKQVALTVFQPFTETKEVQNIRFLTGKTKIDKVEAEKLWRFAYNSFLDGKCVEMLSKGLCYQKSCTHEKMIRKVLVLAGGCSKIIRPLMRHINLDAFPPVVRYCDQKVVCSFVGFLFETCMFPSIDSFLVNWCMPASSTHKQIV